MLYGGRKVVVGPYTTHTHQSGDHRRCAERLTTIGGGISPVVRRTKDVMHSRDCIVDFAGEREEEEGEGEGDE